MAKTEAQLAKIKKWKEQGKTKKVEKRCLKRLSQPKVTNQGVSYASCTDGLKVIVDLNQVKSNWQRVASSIPKRLSKKKFLELKQANKKTKSNGPATDTTATIDSKTDTSKKIWFDGVDKSLLEETSKSTSEMSTTNNLGELASLSKVNPSAKLTRAIAMDCEMVGVGENGVDSVLARISLVNELCECIYDKYVIPTEPVTDYRTAVSGIRPNDLKKENGAVKFKIVQAEVAELIKNRILIGHAIHNDLKVLFLDHAKKKIRDTQKAKFLRTKNKSIGSLTSLKNLARLLLGIEIQSGEHDSIQDAQVTMRIYTMYKKEWEAELRERRALKRKEASLANPNRKKKANGKNLSSDDDDDDENESIKARTSSDYDMIKPDDLGVIGQLNSTTSLDAADEKLKGNENHKRYLKNKFKRRSNSKKSFLNKKN